MDRDDILAQFNEMFPTWIESIKSVEQTNTDEVELTFRDGKAYRFGFRGVDEVYFERVKEAV